MSHIVCTSILESSTSKSDIYIKYHLKMAKKKTEKAEEKAEEEPTTVGPAGQTPAPRRKKQLKPLPKFGLEPKTPSSVRRAPHRQALQHSVSVVPTGTPLSTRTPRRKKLPDLRLPDIPSPGNLRAIKEEEEEEDSEGYDELLEGMKKLGLPKGTEVETKPAKKGKGKGASRAKTPKTRANAKKAMQKEENKETEDTEDMEVDKMEDDDASAAEESDNDTDGSTLSGKIQLTSEQQDLRERVLEFTRDKKWATTSIWETQAQDTLDVGSEIKRLDEEGE